MTTPAELRSEQQFLLKLAAAWTDYVAALPAESEPLDPARWLHIQADARARGGK